MNTILISYYKEEVSLIRKRYENKEINKQLYASRKARLKKNVLVQNNIRLIINLVDTLEEKSSEYYTFKRIDYICKDIYQKTFNTKILLEFINNTDKTKYENTEKNIEFYKKFVSKKKKDFIIDESKRFKSVIDLIK